jgi:hypothetical protein
MHFHDSDNLELIKTMANLLPEVGDTEKAVICYDLGEFSKYFVQGK